MSVDTLMLPLSPGANNWQLAFLKISLWEASFFLMYLNVLLTLKLQFLWIQLFHSSSTTTKKFSFVSLRNYSILRNYVIVETQNST